jgi:hypothetical protein
MRVVLAKVKETKNMVRFEYNANGVIITAYVAKTSLPTNVESLAVDISLATDAEEAQAAT